MVIIRKGIKKQHDYEAMFTGLEIKKINFSILLFIYIQTDFVALKCTNACFFMHSCSHVQEARQKM